MGRRGDKDGGLPNWPRFSEGQRIVTDLQFAPRNARGMVEYVATFTLVKPVDLAKANGVLLYAAPNHGNRISIPAFSVTGESGDEFFLKRVLPMLVPKVDADGNETSGIQSPLHQAPLGTYLGWNVTRTGFYKGRGCGFAGGFIPFAKTKAERLATGDPRLSLEERYRDHASYVAAVKKAVERLLSQRFLLPEDAERLIRQAEESNVLR